MVFIILLSSADFFKINFLKINLSGPLSECQTVWIEIRTGVQIVRVGYQQTTKVHSELHTYLVASFDTVLFPRSFPCFRFWPLYHSTYLKLALFPQNTFGPMICRVHAFLYQPFPGIEWSSIIELTQLQNMRRVCDQN